MARQKWCLYATFFLCVLLVATSVLALVSASSPIFLQTDIEVSPTPDPQQVITLVQTDWAGCRGEDGAPDDYYWLVLRVRNSSPNLAAKGESVMRIVDAAGKVVTRYLLGSYGAQDESQFTQYHLTLPADAESWIVVGEVLTQRATLRVPGGAANQVELRYGELYWQELDGSEALYSWGSDLLAHVASDEPYPRHSVTLEIVNEGRDTMYQTKVFGLVYNSKGALVDILWSETPGSWPVGFRLQPGERRRVTVKTIAQTGRCLGPRDDAGYSLTYWVNTLTSSGIPLVRSETVALP